MASAPSAKEGLNESIDLLSRTTVVAIFYTLLFILYCLSIRLCYAQFRDGKIKRQTVCTLIVQTVLLICATLDVIVCNRIAQVTYIDNSSLPDGPLGPEATLSVATLVNLDSVVTVIEVLSTLGLLLWRVWVVWGGTRFVISLTIILSFFYLASAGLMITENVLLWNINTTTLPAAQRVEGIVFIMASILSLASLAFMALAIIARLLFIRRRHVKLMGSSDVAGQYLGIAAMLIESYALDTLWGIGLLISFGLGYAPTTSLFNNCLIQVDILTNFLLIYRVHSGRAWTRQTQNRLSTLRWGSDEGDTTSSGTVDIWQTRMPEQGPPAISFRDGV